MDYTGEFFVPKTGKIVRLVAGNIAVLLLILISLNLIAAVILEVQYVFRKAFFATDKRVELPNYTDKEWATTILDEFRQSSAVGRDDWNRARHRLQRYQPEGLLQRWQQQQVGTRDESVNLVDRVEKSDAIGKPELCDLFLGGTPLGPISYHQQPCGQLAGDTGKDSDDIRHPFYGSEIGHVNDQMLTGIGEARP